MQQKVFRDNLHSASRTNTHAGVTLLAAGATTIKVSKTSQAMIPIMPIAFRPKDFKNGTVDEAEIRERFNSWIDTVNALTPADEEDNSDDETDASDVTPAIKDLSAKARTKRKTGEKSTANNELSECSNTAAHQNPFDAEEDELDYIPVSAATLRMHLMTHLVGPVLRQRQIERRFEDDGSRWICHTCQEWAHAPEQQRHEYSSMSSLARHE